DERGPFTGNPNSSVSLSPAVKLQQGDLIGITRLKPCGGPSTNFDTILPQSFLSFSGDVEGSVSLSAGTRGIYNLNVQAIGTATDFFSGLIPVAVSAPGRFGSSFRTAVQVHNPPFGTVAGRFVFHPAGVPASSADPSLPFTLDAGQT